MPHVLTTSSVEGEKRDCFTLPVDRFDGAIVGQQLEEVARSGYRAVRFITWRRLSNALRIGLGSFVRTRQGCRM
jgi:hypothetical protein